jgi:putative membrane protein
MWTELAISVLITLFVYVSYHEFGWHRVSLPFSIAAILGSALAIFIAFRNNSSYSRWWEARTLWGGIVNSSRVFARLVCTFTDSHKHQPNYEAARSENFKHTLINLQIAWAHALRFHLRRQENWSELKPYLTPDDFEAMMKSTNKPNYLQTIMGNHIYRAMSNGTLGGFDSFQMEGQLLALANYQGGCERIKNTPLLRQYHFFTKLFLFVFMIVLPFSLIGDFNRMEMTWMTVPVSILISFVFAVMGKVGEVNEDPFENRITDVPLTSLCNTIERDLLETLGNHTLPEKLTPINGYLD